MARHIVDPRTQQPATLTAVARTSHVGVRSTGRTLTTPRSRHHLQAVARLDTAASLTGPELGDLIDELRREFDEKWAATPLGLVARCYLGHPYEVHILGFDQHIVEHFEHGQSLPAELERARTTAHDDMYSHIEVYRDKLICVRADGSTATLEV